MGDTPGVFEEQPVGLEQSERKGIIGDYLHGGQIL